jgi:hypothetical protein
MVDLSLAAEVDRGLSLAKIPLAERLAFLVVAERKALDRGDEELVKAIAQWRLRQQIEGENPKA